MPLMHERWYRWPAWKAAAQQHPGVRPQAQEVGGVLTIYFFDGSVTHACNLWRSGFTDLPDFDAAANAAALAEWDAVWTATANLPVTANTSIGLPAYVNLDFPEQASDLMKSWQVEAAGGQLAVLDIGIMNDLVGPSGICYMAGGEYRCRTAAAEGSALNFMVVDRDDTLGYFEPLGLSRSRLEGLTDMAGTFQPGEVIVGATSGCRAKVLGVDGSTLYITFWRWDSNDRPATFEDGETITGQTSGASATSGLFVEGDVLVLKPYVRDEWVEGFDVREVRPGGSKALPQGLYFRVMLYNAGVDLLRVKVSLILATS